MNELVDFIKTNEDWEVKLKEAPYYLTINKDTEQIHLRLFKYNQIKSDMNLPIVQLSRGIIIDVEDILNPFVVAHAFDKFFNYNDNRAHTINWSTAKILEKVDGSIMKLFCYYGQWCISTNGVINAFKTDLPMTGSNGLDSFGKLFTIASENQGLDYNELDEDLTYIFEITSHYNRVVVPHKEISITHLGTRNNKTGQECDVDIGIKKPKEYSFNTFEDMVSASINLPYDDEGYVVLDDNCNRVKVKSLAYLACHHLADNGNVSNKRVLQLIISGEDEELLKYYPEYSQVFEEVRAKYERHLGVILAIKLLEQEWSEKYTSDKAFAQAVVKYTEKDVHPYMFALRKNKVDMLEKLNRTLTYEKLLTKITKEN
jgi:tRNA splicing ligase